MSTWLLLVAIALAAASGAPGLLLPPRGLAGQRLCCALQLLAAALGALGAALALAAGAGPTVQVAASAALPPLSFGVDALSAAFALPVCLLCGCAAVYDLGYWSPQAHPRGGRLLRAGMGLLFAGLLGVLVARDGVGFLIAWETMALAAFFLVATERWLAEVRGASWIYLAATHAGTLLLFAFFAGFAAARGDFTLAPAAPERFAPGQQDLLFVLALLGFGLKAGLVPLHFWLPPAHAAAPSHVSAVMSGVLIKMGVYGLLRAGSLLPLPPPWWGHLLLGLGAGSAVLGVAFAIGQHDLKRLLAWHSIENIGIICLGAGLALLGRAGGNQELVVLGLGGALLHVWNHGLFKGLLFLAAGATAHAAGTREIDRLGGLGRRMPGTAAAFLCGAVAISGLPPLNGFVSELLVYLGLFRALAADAGTAAAAAIAIPALALTGAMALLCFVKVFGVVYLGAPRSPAAAEAHEAGRAMLLPMAALAAGCAVIGFLPSLGAGALQAAIAGWLPLGPGAPALPRLAALAPLGAVGAAAAAVTAAALGLYALLARRRRPAAVGTWDCGYLRPSPAMQYTAASFAQLFVFFLRRVLWPRTRRLAGDPLFPRSGSFSTVVPDPVLDRLLLPALRLCAQGCNHLRLLQRGRVQVYLLYVFVTLLVLLLFT